MRENRQILQSNNDIKTGNATFFKGHVIQPKLQINEPGDNYEQEADHMADKVMRMADPSLNKNSFFKPANVAIQRKCALCEEADKKLQRKENSSSDIQADGQLNNYVDTLGSSGQSMSSTARQFFEPRFGMDFSEVKIHTDSVAAKSAQSINALAYTTGNNIVFNSGQYSPETDTGKKLIAHELTHVVQQQRNIQPKLIQRFTPSCEGLLNNQSAAGIRVLSGAAVHTAIQADFAEKVAGAGNLAIPGASASALRTAGLCGEDLPVTAPQVIGGRAGMGFPDLAILGNPIAQVAEIKPASWGCATDGTFQLAGYVTQGNATDPEQAAWRASMGIASIVPMNPTVYPGKTMPIGGYTVVTEWCAPGLLVYQVVGSNSPQPVPLPLPQTAPNQKKVPQQNPVTPPVVPNPTPVTPPVTALPPTTVAPPATVPSQSDGVPTWVYVAGGAAGALAIAACFASGVCEAAAIVAAFGVAADEVLAYLAAAGIALRFAN